MSPSLNHSYLCRRIIVELEKTEQWEAWPELTLDIGNGMIADIAVYKKGTLQPNFHEDTIKCAVLPQLVIKVISPTQSIHDLMQKADKFLQAGIPAVWTVEPYGKIIYVSQKGSRHVEPAGVVTTGDIILDFLPVFGLRNGVFFNTDDIAMQQEITPELLTEWGKKREAQILARQPAEKLLSRLTVGERLTGLTSEERLSGLTVEERLTGLSSKEVLQYYSLDDLLDVLSLEERLAGLSKEEVEQYLQKLKSSSS